MRRDNPIIQHPQARLQPESASGDLKREKIMKQRKKEFHRHRSEMNEKILGYGFKDYQKFFALDNKAYLEGEGA
jgi:hypothetical protein